MSHPHPSREHVMRSYRRYLIGEKRYAAKQGRSFRRGARSLIHYREYISEYLEAKRDVIESKISVFS